MWFTPCPQGLTDSGGDEAFDLCLVRVRRSIPVIALILVKVVAVAIAWGTLVIAVAQGGGGRESQKRGQRGETSGGRLPGQLTPDQIVLLRELLTPREIVLLIHRTRHCQTPEMSSYARLVRDELRKRECCPASDLNRSRPATWFGGTSRIQSRE